jgi:hypothetical protein
MKWLQAIRKAVGKLTDWLVAGRAMGWWNRKPGVVDDKPRWPEGR